MNPVRRSFFAFPLCPEELQWLGVSELLCFLLCLYAGANPSRPGGFPGANSPGPVADLYAPSNQDSAVGNYITAASPQPGSGFGPSITVSTNVNCVLYPTPPRAYNSVRIASLKSDTKPMHADHDCNVHLLKESADIFQP